LSGAFFVVPTVRRKATSERIKAMLKELIGAVTSPTERRTLRSHPDQVMERLNWVVQDRGLKSPRTIIGEIMGAKTAIGVLLKNGGREVLPAALVSAN
jgi:hypothetical protein